MAADVTKCRHDFAHQGLRVQEFKDEQDSLIDRRRRPSTGFHSRGVVQGLGVVASSVANQGHVETGWAVNAQGQEIVNEAVREERGDETSWWGLVFPFLHSAPAICYEKSLKVT
jgi:hypothetical protein